MRRLPQEGVGRGLKAARFLLAVCLVSVAAPALGQGVRVVDADGQASPENCEVSGRASAVRYSVFEPLSTAGTGRMPRST